MPVTLFYEELRCGYSLCRLCRVGCCFGLYDTNVGVSLVRDLRIFWTGIRVRALMGMIRVMFSRLFLIGRLIRLLFWMLT